MAPPPSEAPLARARPYLWRSPARIQDPGSAGAEVVRYTERGVFLIPQHHPSAFSAYRKSGEGK